MEKETAACVEVLVEDKAVVQMEDAVDKEVHLEAVVQMEDAVDKEVHLEDEAALGAEEAVGKDSRRRADKSHNRPSGHCLLECTPSPDSTSQTCRTPSCSLRHRMARWNRRSTAHGYNRGWQSNPSSCHPDSPAGDRPASCSSN